MGGRSRVDDATELSGRNIIGVMWILLGGMQLVSGAWAAVASVAMAIMSLLPRVGAVPRAFRVFIVAAPIASMIQCSLAGLFLYGAIRLIQSRAESERLIRVLCWLAMGFYWSCGLGMLALSVSVTSHRQNEAVAVSRLVFSAIALGTAIACSIPPIITIQVLKSQVSSGVGRPASPALGP